MSFGRRIAAGALLALSLAPAAHAGDELHLRWDNCFGDGGVYNKVFACDTNAGSEVLVGSFRLAATVDSVSSVEAVLDLAAVGPTMPLWWSMRASAPVGCRPTSLSLGISAPATSTACLDPWTGQTAAGGFSMDAPSVPNAARIHVLAQLASPTTFTAEAGQEVFTFQLRIDHARTVGPSACGGCSTPVCIAWGQGRLDRPALVRQVLVTGFTTPDNGSNVTWQPGAVATTAGSCDIFGVCQTSVTCLSVTPARPSTWGSIKTLYR